MLQWTIIIRSNMKPSEIFEGKNSSMYKTFMEATKPKTQYWNKQLKVWQDEKTAEYLKKK